LRTVRLPRHLTWIRQRQPFLTCRPL